MPRPKKTEAEKAQMRQRILDCAEAILRANGPEAISSRSIAERLGMAHMSLFTYFVNQQDILQHLVERDTVKLIAEINEIETRLTPAQYPEIVKEILTYMVHYATEYPNMYRLAWVSPHMGYESHEQNCIRVNTIASHLARVLAYGMEHGLLYKRDPYVTALTVMTMVNAPFFMLYSGKYPDLAACMVIANQVNAAALHYLTHGFEPLP
jgi:AcrR family transcriptional regulator